MCRGTWQWYQSSNVICKLCISRNTEVSHSPEELVKVPMFHIFKHHDERVALHTHTVEGDDVFVLQVGEELRLSVEVCSAALVGFFQGLMKRQKCKDGGATVKNRIYRKVHPANRFLCIDYLPDLYLDCHMEFLLVRCQVVALSQKHFSKGSLSQLPFQHNVVSLDVLDNLKPQQDKKKQKLNSQGHLRFGAAAEHHIQLCG